MVGSIRGTPRPNSGSMDSAAGVGAGGDHEANISARSTDADSPAPPPGRKYPTAPLPDQSGFLGKGTDMKSKTRPKREPEWEEPPQGYQAKSAPGEPFWLPDIPWTPPGGGGKGHHHHHPGHKHPPKP
jgi:hypothetical protein